MSELQVFMDYAPLKNCKNPDSYGMICVQCNQCGRFTPCKEVYDLLCQEPEPAELGNTNKSGECGMCGKDAKALFPQKVGQVDFMICENCKLIMEMGWDD